jgi:hypothetical protein
MPLEHLYLSLVLFSYLGIVEPILEKIFKKEIILEHFLVILGMKLIGDRLTRKDFKRLLVAQYLFVAFASASQIYYGDGYLQGIHELRPSEWSIYIPIPFLLYFGIVEPILERLLKDELMLTHFWILPSEVLTDRQLKRRWIVAYLGAIVILVAISGLLGL